MSMSVSAMVVVAQMGTTIGMGLLFDTLVIRAFMTPSIAALLGRWFWWPQTVRPRPVPAKWPSVTPSPATSAAPSSAGP
jgi:RND superfamily putative drug exporter